MATVGVNPSAVVGENTSAPVYPGNISLTGDWDGSRGKS